MTEQALSLLLTCIAAVESGNNPDAVGRHGERGAFQMSPAVVAECGGYSERHAMRWLLQLERDLIRANVDVMPFNLALAWNAGIGAAISGKAPMASYDYALRVANLYTYSSLNSGAAADSAQQGCNAMGVHSAAAPVSFQLNTNHRK